MHSVVSGKKVITYNGHQIHHSDDMSRSFSHSWFEGNHALRVDITDIVEVGRGRSDKMYELTVCYCFHPVKCVYCEIASFQII